MNYINGVRADGLYDRRDEKTKDRERQAAHRRSVGAHHRTHNKLPDFTAAACAGQPTEWWYPELEQGQNAYSHAAVAMNICIDCPLQQKCLDYAVKAGEQGVWGGIYLGEGNRSDVLARRIRRLNKMIAEGRKFPTGPPAAAFASRKTYKARKLRLVKEVAVNG